MIESAKVFVEEGKTEMDMEDAIPHYWQCYNCGESVFTSNPDYESIIGYERKGIVRCEDCGYTDIIHFWYRDEKTMNYLPPGQDVQKQEIGLVMTYYYTGKHRVKTLIEEGPKALSITREPRSEHPAYDGHSAVPPLEKALKDTDMIPHMDYSQMALPNEPTRGPEHEEISTDGE